MARRTATQQPELFKPQYLASLDSPIGKVWVESDGERITRVTFDNPGRGRNTKPPKVLKEAVTQLKAYFAGRRKKFDLPLYLVGSPYRQEVWKQLGKVPYGKAITYDELAAGAGGAAHTAGAACAINPLPILVPCHRVLGTDGLLTSYVGQIWRKKWLLVHEGVLGDG
jgi:methylated-DNA-[protein]-cysteine S-methyltransferase